MIEGDGEVSVIANLSDWFRANPVANPPTLSDDPDGAPMAMASIDGTFWVVDGHTNQVLRVGLDGTIARIADLSPTQVMLRDIVPSPNGGAYVASLGPPPFDRRAGKILHIGDDGSVTDVWTKLTAAAAVAVDATGTLYALEIATGNSVVPPFQTRRSGRLLRQTSADSSEALAR